MRDTHELSDIERQANWALSRHYEGDGRWGRKESGTRSSWKGLVVTKYRPRKVRWEQSVALQSGMAKRKVHAVRYRLTVHREKGPKALIRQVTVWQCGQQSRGPHLPRLIKEPDQVCGACYAKIIGQPTTVSLREMQ